MYARRRDNNQFYWFLHEARRLSVSKVYRPQLCSEETVHCGTSDINWF